MFEGYKLRRAGTSESFTAVNFNLIKSTDTAGKPYAGAVKTAEAPMPYRSTPLLDAAMPIEVDKNDYFWEEWPVTVPSAGDVAEGAPKPEANIQPELKSGKLGKAAHWITVTEEALEDNAGLRSRIDGELVDGVRQRGEEKAIEALVAATLPTATHETLMKAIRVGVATVQMSGFGTGGQLTVVLNPMQYADIDIELLALTLNGARANSPLWNLSIVPAGAVAAGTAYVGDIYRGLRKYYRSEAMMSDSHAGLFLENKYVILAEQRLSVHVVRPEAIVEVTATPVVPTAGPPSPAPTSRVRGRNRPRHPSGGHAGRTGTPMAKLETVAGFRAWAGTNIPGNVPDQLIPRRAGRGGIDACGRCAVRDGGRDHRQLGREPHRARRSAAAGAEPAGETQLAGRVLGDRRGRVHHHPRGPLPGPCPQCGRSRHTSGYRSW